MFESRFYSPPQVAKVFGVNPNVVRSWTDPQTGHPTGNVLPAMNTASKFRERLKIWGPDAEQFYRDCSAAEKVSRQRRARVSVTAPAKNYLG